MPFIDHKEESGKRLSQANKFVLGEEGGKVDERKFRHRHPQLLELF